MAPQLELFPGILPKYVNPSERDYATHFDHVKAFNLGLQERVSRLLPGLIGYNDNFAFTTTGSDGRLEKGPQSKVEIYLLSSNGFISPEKQSEIKTKLS